MYCSPHRTSKLIVSSFGLVSQCRSCYVHAPAPKHASGSFDPKLQNLPSDFRCLENFPPNHNSRHEAQFYKIPVEDFRHLFSIGVLEKATQKKIMTFGEFCLMVRQPSLEIMNCLENTNYSFPVNRYLLYGVRGCGKSSCLYHILHYFYVKKFLLIHVPWAPFWARMFKEAVPSVYSPGRFDMPVEAVVWLQNFKLQNSALLQEKQPRISNTYTWSKREVTEAGSLLTDLIDQGINRAKFSSDCVGAIVKEARLLANSGQCQVAVIIDGVNALFQKTRVTRDDRSPVPPEKLTLMNAFRKILKNDWKNGAIVATADIIGSPSDVRESYLPRYLLGKVGFETMDPFVPVAVSNYTDKEINSCLDYYTDRMWIQSEAGRSEEGRKELIFLSGHNPRTLLAVCAPH